MVGTPEQKKDTDTVGERMPDQRMPECIRKPIMQVGNEVHGILVVGLLVSCNQGIDEGDACFDVHQHYLEIIIVGTDERGPNKSQPDQFKVVGCNRFHVDLSNEKKAITKLPFV
jgi:hypothetical protein